MAIIVIGCLVLLAVIALMSVSAVSIQRQETAHKNGFAGASPPSVSDELQLVPHLGRRSSGKEEEEPPEFDEKEIKANYSITYARRIYLNKRFILSVRIAQDAAMIAPGAGEQVGGQGGLSFVHRYLSGQDPEPDPTIRVDLKYAESELLVSPSSAQKPYKPGQVTEFEFSAKPLKAEDVAIVVQISYVGTKWVPRTVTEIKTTTDDNAESTTLTMTPSKLIEDTHLLVQTPLNIGVASFLGLDAASLNILTKAAAVFLTVIYVIVAISTGQADNSVNAVIVGISSVASILGIPLAADLWKNVSAKQEKKESKT